MRGSRARFANVSRVTERPSRAKTWGGRLCGFDHAFFRERFAITRLRKEEIRGLSLGYRQLGTGTASDRRFERKFSSDVPGGGFLLHVPAKPTTYLRSIFEPTVRWSWIHRQAALRHQLFQIPKAQATPAVQSYADHTMLGSNWRFRKRGGRLGFMPSPFQIRRCNTSDKRIGDFGLSVAPRSYRQETRSSSHLTLEKVLKSIT
jgi:hypothetical protein